MVATKQQAIGLAIISGLTLAAGIAVMVLFNYWFKAVIELSGATALPAIGVFWPYGVPVLLVGVLGLVAAAVRNNIGVGIYMGICIVCLVVEGVFAILCGLVLVALMALSTGTCYMVEGTCQCSSEIQIGPPCEGSVRVENMLHLATAACAMVIVAWALMLTGAIVSCVACCCGRREASTVFMHMK